MIEKHMEGNVIGI